VWAGLAGLYRVFVWRCSLGIDSVRCNSAFSHFHIEMHVVRFVYMRPSSKRSPTVQGRSPLLSWWVMKPQVPLAIGS
jgi:hypothetical protein